MYLLLFAFPVLAPKLVATYNAMKAVPRIGDDVEFIFISSDRDEASFREYFGEVRVSE